MGAAELPSACAVASSVGLPLAISWAVGLGTIACDIFWAKLAGRCAGAQRRFALRCRRRIPASYGRIDKQKGTTSMLRIRSRALGLLTVAAVLAVIALGAYAVGRPSHAAAQNTTPAAASQDSPAATPAPDEEGEHMGHMDMDEEMPMHGMMEGMGMHGMMGDDDMDMHAKGLHGMHARQGTYHLARMGVMLQYFGMFVQLLGVPDDSPMLVWMDEMMAQMEPQIEELRAGEQISGTLPLTGTLPMTATVPISGAAGMMDAMPMHGMMAESTVMTDTMPMMGLHGMEMDGMDIHDMMKHGEEMRGAHRMARMGRVMQFLGMMMEMVGLRTEGQLD